MQDLFLTVFAWAAIVMFATVFGVGIVDLISSSIKKEIREAVSAAIITTVFGILLTVAIIALHGGINLGLIYGK